MIQAEDVIFGFYYSSDRKSSILKAINECCIQKGTRG